MIRLTCNHEGLMAEQWCAAPTVYLDHWAWRKISESQKLSSRFCHSLKSSGGTLAFSWLNLIEWSAVTDPRQAKRSSNLLDVALPNAFLLYPNFFKVIETEDTLIAGGAPNAPPADMVTSDWFVKEGLRARGSVKPFDAGDLFGLVQACGMRAKFNDFANLVVKELRRLKKHRNGQSTLSTFFRAPKGQPVLRGTRFLARELIGCFLRDKPVKLDRNNAIDLCHAVVAAAYCDYALLDRGWEDRSYRRRTVFAKQECISP